MELKNATDIIGAVMTALLALLWWDIRNIRIGRVKDDNSLRNRREGDLTMMHDTFLKKEDHKMLCANAVLRLEATMASVVKAAVVEIKAEIKKQ